LNGKIQLKHWEGFAVILILETAAVLIDETYPVQLLKDSAILNYQKILKKILEDYLNEIFLLYWLIHSKSKLRAIINPTLGLELPFF
jgi:hypothetical protein